MLIRDDGTTIMDQEAITREAVEFYINLLGKTNQHMPVARQKIIKAGSVLHET